jgi:hypothetical protein
VLKGQRDYSEGTLLLTPTTLVSKADQECQVLKHAGQWVETIDPSVLAMQAMIQTTKQTSGDLLQSLAANFSSILQKQRDKHSRYTTRNASQDTPEWLLKPPTSQGQIKHFNGRDWHFCTKSGCNGRWVCTHTDATHNDSRRYAAHDDDRSSFSPTYSNQRSYSSYSNRDSYNARSRSPARSDGRQLKHQNFSRSRSRSPINGYQSNTSSSSHKRVSWETSLPATPVAKLSLLDFINLFNDED